MLKQACRHARRMRTGSLVQLGAEGHLVGTLVQPTGPSAAVGVLFVNAGVIHRIGPHRIHVKIGRVLAQDGVPSLRLDLTGLGDSGRAGGTDGMLAQVRRDIRAALDLLAERTGLSRFVIIGICSGAEYGYQYALDDERVAGLVMVDGYSFGNRRTRMLRYLLRLRTLTWPVFEEVPCWGGWHGCVRVVASPRHRWTTGCPC